MFYILKEGRVRVEKKEADSDKITTAVLEAGSYFGELALLRKDKRAASIICESAKAVCLTLDKSHFDNLLGSLKGLMDRRTSAYESNLNEKIHAIAQISQQTVRDKVSKLKDLKTIGLLG